MRFLVFLYCLFQVSLSNAEDINLGITQTSKDDQVTVTVENNSRQPVRINRLEFILDKKTYVIDWTGDIVSGHKKHFDFEVQVPKIAGTYAQQINLYYLNDSKLFTLTDIGVFYYQEPFDLLTADTLSSYSQRTGVLNLKSSKPDKWRIVLPREVMVRNLISTTDDSRRYIISGNYSGFNNNYPVFAVAEGIKDNRHYAQILKTSLKVRHTQGSAQRGWTSNSLLLPIILLSLAAYIFSLVKIVSDSRYAGNILAYSARLFWLSACYYLLKNSPQFLTDSAQYFEQFSGNAVANYLVNQFYSTSDYLAGKNYTYFFTYFIDAYYWSFVVLYPVYQYYFKPGQQEADKYINALYWAIKPIRILLSRLQIAFKLSTTSATNELQSPVKKGFLILAVKLFFLPLLASWVINNLFHQWNLVLSFDWTFHQINAFILALLILVDTSIFLTGYSFESYRAKNQIRSVEPTLLGWVVCLWCYPPFNDYSFNIFDYQLFSIHISIQEWAKPVVLGSITVLWGIFVWASITLGLKASNLTNRGTVSNGPYRYCRHPAYTAKVMIWAIEAVFLGKYFVGLLFGFALIYFLRAWTEERHLAMDEEYREYQQRVPYRFIPGVC